MDVYYHVKFQLCIISGSKVSRGVQNCTPPGIGCDQTPPGIGLRDKGVLSRSKSYFCEASAAKPRKIPKGF